MSQEDVLVECHVVDGMFSDEVVVELADKSFIVPKAEVSRSGSDGAKGKLRAKLVASNGKRWIVLPTNYSESIPESSAKIVK